LPSALLPLALACRWCDEGRIALAVVLPRCSWLHLANGLVWDKVIAPAVVSCPVAFGFRLLVIWDRLHCPGCCCLLVHYLLLELADNLMLDSLCYPFSCLLSHCLWLWLPDESRPFALPWLLPSGPLPVALAC